MIPKKSVKFNIVFFIIRLLHFILKFLGLRLRDLGRDGSCNIENGFDINPSCYSDEICKLIHNEFLQIHYHECVKQTSKAQNTSNHTK